MRTVIQRVAKASVQINAAEERKISKGLAILIGIEEEDNYEDADWLAAKIAKLRIFDDANGVMNVSVQEIHGEILIISQFTLHAKTKKGNRPSYIKAAVPEKAIPLYEYFIQKLKLESSCEIQTGEFGANMLLNIFNDGPVTILIDTKNKE